MTIVADPLRARADPDWRKDEVLKKVEECKVSNTPSVILPIEGSSAEEDKMFCRVQLVRLRIGGASELRRREGDEYERLIGREKREEDKEMLSILQLVNVKLTVAIPLKREEDGSRKEEIVTFTREVSAEEAMERSG